MDRTVLFVVHDYPPIRSAGATRPQKFARYLPDFGFRAVVLTTGRYGGLADDAAQGVYRASDVLHALFGLLRRRRAAEAPQEAQFRIATVSNRGALGRLRDAAMVPDTKLGWLVPAVRAGLRIVARERPVAIFSSSPPETTHLVARRLANATGLPWVADLRDGWLFEPPNAEMRQGRVRRALEARLEAGMIAQAAAVVAVTQPIGADLLARYPSAAGKVHVIANGYDVAEFAGLARQRQADGQFLVVYTGALSASRKATSPAGFFAALAAHVRRTPATPVRVRVVGDTNPQEQAAARALGLEDFVTFLPPVPARAAHQHQVDADALLLITPPGERSVATLKLFDYIGAGRPILALARDNAAAAIVEEYHLGVTAAPDDPAAIEGALGRLLAAHEAGAAWPGFAQAQVRFERRALAGELAALLSAVAR